jgi:hypothetical protein
MGLIRWSGRCGGSEVRILVACWRPVSHQGAVITVSVGSRPAFAMK